MAQKTDFAGVKRRDFIKLSAGAISAGLAHPLLAAAGPPYKVGVGNDPWAYAATMRAITASEGWNPANIIGRKVIIKPNLVRAAAADSGVSTDSEVVRAVVDLALQAGASEILIVEASPDGANFSGSGYDYFDTYDPDGRVRLVDLATQPVVLADVAKPLAYRQIYMPAMLFEENTYLISVAKLKVHNLAQATLSMKNMYGMPPIEHYISPPYRGRFAMHDRSVSQSAIDINSTRPIDFAVIDGIWGLERDGPISGDPKRMDLVIAGDNALAVDLIGLAAMQIPVQNVQHLRYATLMGFGPATASDIEVLGDSFTPQAFLQTQYLPMVNYPRSSPVLFAPARGQSTTIRYAVDTLCAIRVEIVLASETSAGLTPVRTLREWGIQAAGAAVADWDGYDDAGIVAPPGIYGIRVSSKGLNTNKVMHAFGWLRVIA